jgi:hypothetical protein
VGSCYGPSNFAGGAEVIALAVAVLGLMLALIAVLVGVVRALRD